jgi:hypothetical protein
MFKRIGFWDLVIVASCVAVFAVAMTQTVEKSRRHDQAAPHHPPSPPQGPPIAGIAKVLDVPSERVRKAFDKVGPPSDTPFQAPSKQQLADHSRKLAAVLDVPVERLRSNLASYPPPPAP